MAGSYVVLAHTADTGVAAEADTLAELFEWVAVGMFSLTYALEGLAPDRTLEIAIEAVSVDELLVDVLSELLYWSEADEVVPCTFDVREISSTTLRLVAGVVPATEDLLIGPPVKAVTYHDLVVDQNPRGHWRAQVILDV
jgi:SHS2 domain-containing protein